MFILIIESMFNLYKLGYLYLMSILSVKIGLTCGHCNFQIVFLQCDRYIEFHVGHGRHYRLRVPRFGRDIGYHKPSCDLFVVGASSVSIFFFQEYHIHTA